MGFHANGHGYEKANIHMVDNDELLHRQCFTMLLLHISVLNVFPNSSKIVSKQDR